MKDHLTNERHGLWLIAAVLDGQGAAELFCLDRDFAKVAIGMMTDSLIHTEIPFTAFGDQLIIGGQMVVKKSLPY